VRLFHATSPEPAEAILTEGFRDAEGSYMLVDLTLTGVWVSNVPLDENEGAKGSTTIEVILPDDVDLNDYELIDESGHSGYREWCVPADVLNEHGSLRLLSEDELDEIAVARWVHRG
jgi:hypothetical protein